MNKLTKIQNELKAKKSCYNKFGKYNYRKCEDILEALKPLLLKHECCLVIDDSVGHCGDYTYIESCVSFNDGGETTHTACAQAGIEKAGGMALPQAFGAASSYSRKYALGAMFLLDDTEDADATNEHKPTPKQKPIDKARAIELLSQAVDGEALKNAWLSIAKHPIAKNEDVIGLKEARKAEFTTK
jgi:hypothetical protein